jgi:hypothetical protein
MLRKRNSHIFILSKEHVRVIEQPVTIITFLGATKRMLSILRKQETKYNC